MVELRIKQEFTAQSSRLCIVNLHSSVLLCKSHSPCCARHNASLKHSLPRHRSKGIKPTESNGIVLACDTIVLLPLVSVEVDKAAAIDTLSGEIAASLAMRRLLICVSAASRQLSTNKLMAAGEIGSTVLRSSAKQKSHYARVV